ncbi:MULTISPECIES: SCO2584 family spore wall biosynthesis protein [unclassified Streptomyces]|uniref:SCO2584 family spore wall biosynthesis protein n=1 Tax=unclassified Streptomyces TaxID=2593676 RepID=UPI0033A1DD9D
MPEDVGGTPFADGWEPDDDRDRGGADEEFASVVFDEDFVRAAVVHEPTAVERLLAAAQARAEASEAEARRARTRRTRGDDERYEDGFDPDEHGDFGHDPDLDDLDDTEVLEGRYGAPGTYGRLYGKQARWHRPVAWMLALVMGIGMVALAFAAVYRGTSSGRQEQVPPSTSTGVGQGQDKVTGTGPSASADHSQPAMSAVPRTP